MSGGGAFMFQRPPTATGGSTLTAPIGAGGSARGKGAVHAFAANTCTPAGGTAPYTYAWSESYDANGIWTPLTATTASITPAVAGVGGGVTARATFKCTVTDNVGAVAVSNLAGYDYTCTDTGGGYY